MPRSARTFLPGLALAAGTAVVAAPATAASASPSNHYDHVFVFVEENHGFSDVIGNPAAPNLNALAEKYGIATNYFAVTHPSEPNYVALLGGSPFSVQDDDAYYLPDHEIAAPSLVSEFDRAGVSWKAYLQIP